MRDVGLKRGAAAVLLGAMLASSSPGGQSAAGSSVNNIAVVSSGGGAAASTSFWLVDVIGQAAPVGSAASASYRNESGLTSQAKNESAVSTWTLYD